MVDFAAPLNGRQLDVLRWIGRGCPDGVMEGHLHKRIAVALQDRKLVKISQKGGTWRAEPTDAGRYYIEHGCYPDGLWKPGKALPVPALPTAAPSHRVPDKQTPATAESPEGGSAPAPAVRRAPRPKPLSVTEQLIADVIAAGGELHVNAETDKTNYDQRVAAAIRHGKVPEGKLLIIERGRNWRERIIKLQDPPEWVTAVLAPIPVPATLRKPHKIIAAFKDDTELLPVTTQVRGRACRLLQALIHEAENRGYTVQARTNTHRSRRYHEPPGDLLTFTISGHRFGLDLQQQNDRIEHVPTAAELRRTERDTWYRIPSHDQKPSSRLTISVSNGSPYRRSSWSDNTKTQLEEFLSQILQELELRAGFAEEQRLAEERRRAEERRQWEAAMQRANHAYREDHRAEVLKKELAQWQEAQVLDAYLSALRSRIETLRELEKESAQAWLTWAEQYRQAIDPLSCAPAMPKTPEPKPDDLKPFLRRWSPYGPHRSSW